MKIEIETNDLKTLIDGLNNAIIAYNDIKVTLFFCCDHNPKWDILAEEDIDKRLKELHYVYNQLIKIENEEA